MYSCQASAEHFQQCAEFLPLRNRGFGLLAVTVLPILLPGGPPLSFSPPCNRCSARPIVNQNGIVFTTIHRFLEPAHGLTRYAGTCTSNDPEARVQCRRDWRTRPSLPR